MAVRDEDGQVSSIGCYMAEKANFGHKTDGHNSVLMCSVSQLIEKIYRNITVGYDYMELLVKKRIFTFCRIFIEINGNYSLISF